MTHDPTVKKLALELGGSPVDFPVRRLFAAGYTGRDAHLVAAHVAELERHGIPPPDKVPSLYTIDTSWATLDSEIAVGARPVSGEAEPMLLFPGDSLEDALVAVTSDFTDRETERQSIALSKQFPKPLSRRVWRYRDVSAVWDEITLRSWVEPAAGSPFYQLGTLKQMLAPADLLERLRPDLGDSLAGTALLMGTLPLRSPGFSYSEFFACELETPGHSILRYECKLRRSEVLA
jgi:hypothetical protein